MKIAQVDLIKQFTSANFETRFVKPLGIDQLSSVLSESDDRLTVKSSASNSLDRISGVSSTVRIWFRTR